MYRIYKYTLSHIDDTTLLIPEDHEILSIQVQNNIPVLWAKINTAQPNDTKVFIKLYTTGSAINNDEEKYLATCLLHEGQFVVHYFLAAR